MNEKQQIFFIFVGKANLADAKFTCQRRNDIRSGSKGSNRFRSVQAFRERCLRLVECQDFNAPSLNSRARGFSCSPVSSIRLTLQRHLGVR